MHLPMHRLRPYMVGTAAEGASEKVSQEKILTSRRIKILCRSARTIKFSVLL